MPAARAQQQGPRRRHRHRRGGLAVPRGRRLRPCEREASRSGWAARRSSSPGPQFTKAAAALLAGDRAAFDATLPVDGASSSAAAVRERLDEVFDALSPLPWRTFSFAVTPADSGSGVYRVEGSGQLGAAGPPDRLAVVRYLKLEEPADGVAVVADETPQDLRRRYLMALHDPVVAAAPRTDRARRPLGARARRGGARGGGAGAAGAGRSGHGDAADGPRHGLRLGRGRPRRAGHRRRHRSPSLLRASVAARRRGGLAHLGRRGDGPLAPRPRCGDGRRR